MSVQVAGSGTERSNGRGGEVIEGVYVHIENFSEKCRISSDLVGIYVLNPGVEGGIYSFTIFRERSDNMYNSV